MVMVEEEDEGGEGKKGNWLMTDATSFENS